MSPAYVELHRILDQLLAPGGCPWDREQTMLSLRTTVLEEVCELIDAIDVGDNDEIRGELGDLFLNVVFFCKLAEKEQRFSGESVLQELNEKLIRRHPHIFADSKVMDMHGLAHQWEQIKAAEPQHSDRASVLDGIPKGLPALARAQKVVKKVKKAGGSGLPSIYDKTFANEAELGDLLLAIAVAAQEQGLDAEQALRGQLAVREKDFRDSESKFT